MSYTLGLKPQQQQQSGQCSSKDPHLDQGGNTPLIRAASLGYTEEVGRLLKSGARINIQNSCGHTALSRACAAGKREAALLLISAGADLCIADVHGNTPLLWAVKTANEELTRVLLAAGAPPGAADISGRTSLHHAMSSKSKELVQMLLAASASSGSAENQLGKWGSASSSLSYSQHMPGSSTTTSTGTPFGGSPSGMSPQLSLQSPPPPSPPGLLQVSRFLDLDNRALSDCGTPCASGPCSPADRTVSISSVLLSARSSASMTTLRSDNGLVSPFQALAGVVAWREIGVASPSKRAVEQQPLSVRVHGALACLCASVQLGREEEVATQLLTASEDLKLALHRHCDSAGQTALHYAAFKGQCSIVQQLLSCGSPHLALQHRNHEGHTPLSLAAVKGHEACCAALLRAGSSACEVVCGVQESTPLHQACIHGHVGTAQLLLDAGAQVRGRHVGTAQLLLDAGAWVRATWCRGMGEGYLVQGHG